MLCQLREQCLWKSDSPCTGAHALQGQLRQPRTLSPVATELANAVLMFPTSLPLCGVKLPGNQSGAVGPSHRIPSEKVFSSFCLAVATLHRLQCTSVGPGQKNKSWERLYSGHLSQPLFSFYRQKSARKYLQIHIHTLRVNTMNLEKCIIIPVDIL